MLTFKTTDLQRALGICLLVREVRNTIPILGALRVEVKDGKATFTASDLDTTADVVIDVKGEMSPFTITAPANLLRAIVAMNAEEVELSKGGGGNLDIRAGALLMRHTTLPADDFPMPQGPWDNPAFTVSFGADTIADLARVARAVSTEETRYYLNGVLFHKSPGGNPWAYTMVATDGHRLHMADPHWPDGTGELPDSIVPRRLVGLLLNLGRRASNQPIRAAFWNAKVRFELALPGADVTLRSKLIDGTYPDYTRVVPKPENTPLVARFERKRMQRALTALRGSVDGKTKPVKIAIGRAGEATLSISSPEIGTAQIAIPFEGAGQVMPGLEVGFNSAYLLSVISDGLGDEFQMALTDAAAPTLVIDPDDAGFKSVVMPMRV